MKKKVSESYTEQVQILTGANMNGFGRLFGGQLMCWIDIVAAVTARRHSQCNVTTVLVDSLEFKHPARANDTLVITGHITYVGSTSMEVCVNTYIEYNDLSRKLINRAYVVMVALDKFDRPTKVPGLILSNRREKDAWNEALQRKKNRSRLLYTQNDAPCS